MLSNLLQVFLLLSPSFHSRDGCSSGGFAKRNMSRGLQAKTGKRRFCLNSTAQSPASSQMSVSKGSDDFNVPRQDKNNLFQVELNTQRQRDDDYDRELKGISDLHNQITTELVSDSLFMSSVCVINGLHATVFVLSQIITVNHHKTLWTTLDRGPHRLGPSRGCWLL